MVYWYTVGILLPPSKKTNTFEINRDSKPSIGMLSGLGTFANGKRKMCLFTRVELERFIGPVSNHSIYLQLQMKAVEKLERFYFQEVSI